MSIRKCSFLRFLRTTALTSLICFSSSAVYAMDGPEDLDHDASLRRTHPIHFNPFAEGPLSSASERITYRTTFSDPYAVHNRTLIRFDLGKAGYDPNKPLEISINHRTPDEKFSPTIAFFNDRANKYSPIGELPKSDDVTNTSYFIYFSRVYSYLITHNKPKVLQLSFESGVSDIYSVTLQQGTMDKKVLQSIVLEDIRSEDQSRKLLVTLPERSNSNEWSTSHRVMPRPSFAFPDLSSLILLPDPAIFEALSQRGVTQMATFKRLMDKGASFSERLNVAAVAARFVDNKEIALSLVGRLFLDKTISHSERLEVGAVAERIGKGQGIFLFSKLIERADFPFSYRLEIAHSLGEPALFTISALRGITYRTTGSNPDDVHKRSFILATAAARYVDNKEIALSLVGSLFLDKRISPSERLQVGAVADRIGKGQSIFLSSKLIEMADFPFSYRLEIARSLGEPALFTISVLRGITYRTTGSNPDDVHKRSFTLKLHAPDKKFSPTIAFFDDWIKKDCPIGKLPESDGLCFNKKGNLQFQSGVSDIHSVTLQQGGIGKKVLQSVVLRDIRSEDQLKKLVVTSPEWFNSNERSKIHSVTSLREPSLLKFETHESNKLEDRVPATTYLDLEARICD